MRTQVSTVFHQLAINEQMFYYLLRVLLERTSHVCIFVYRAF